MDLKRINTYSVLPTIKDDFLEQIANEDTLEFDLSKFGIDLEEGFRNLTLSSSQDSLGPSSKTASPETPLNSKLPEIINSDVRELLNDLSKKGTKRTLIEEELTRSSDSLASSTTPKEFSFQQEGDITNPEDANRKKRTKRTSTGDELPPFSGSLASPTTLEEFSFHSNLPKIINLDAWQLATSNRNKGGTKRTSTGDELTRSSDSLDSPTTSKGSLPLPPSIIHPDLLLGPNKRIKINLEEYPLTSSKKG